MHNVRLGVLTKKAKVALPDYLIYVECEFLYLHYYYI